MHKKHAGMMAGRVLQLPRLREVPCLPSNAYYQERKKHCYRVTDAQADGVIRALGLNPAAVSTKTMGKALQVEMEHGSMFGAVTDVTENDLVATGRVGLAHLMEFRDYYERLERMEEEADAEWKLWSSVQDRVLLEPLFTLRHRHSTTKDIILLKVPRLGDIACRPSGVGYQETKKHCYLLTNAQANMVIHALGLNPAAVSTKTMLDGLNVEMEHGSMFGKVTNITGDDLVTTGRIVLAHLMKFRDYYERLDRMEEEADVEWKAWLSVKGRAPNPPLFTIE